MTKTRGTKRALLLSVVSVLLCVSMLAGTTWAWFSETITSGRNSINLGYLDVELYYATPADVDEDGNIPESAWEMIDEDTVVFNDNAVWEPGHTEAVYFKVVNKGSVALKYRLTADIYTEIGTTNVNGDEFKTSDYLLTAVLDEDEMDAAADRETAIEQAVSTIEAQSGDLNGAVPTSWAIAGFGGPFSGNYMTSVNLAPGETSESALIILMPSYIGNEANRHPDADAPVLQFGINMVATQTPYESDSYGDDYDADAEIAPVVRDQAQLGQVFVEESENVWELNSNAILIDMPLYSNWAGTEDVVINGNGNKVTMVATATQTFDWTENYTIPLMGNVFSTANGSTTTVNDLVISGTMQSVMMGHYVDGNATAQANFSTIFNNVDIINNKVVSFSSGISPALTVYGTAVLNDCNVYGTTLSELDTDPMWDVYDMAVVNNSTTTINGGKVGSIYTWAKAYMEINDAEIDTINSYIEWRSDFKKSALIIGEGTTVNTINLYENRAVLTIAEGATVDTLDLSALEGMADLNVNITIEGTVNNIVANGATYDSIDAWLAAQ